jgi:hypothetical protein
MFFKIWWCLGQFCKDVYSLEIFKNSPARMLSNVITMKVIFAENKWLNAPYVNFFYVVASAQPL